MRHPVFLLALFVAVPAYAEQPLERPPELQLTADEARAPDELPPITIRPSKEGRVVEYRANGKLYMLKIIPKVGKPYYLIDQKGDGQFARQDSLDSGMRPPLWVIKEF